MDYCDSIRHSRRSTASAALALASELEAGRAQAPFQDRLSALASTEVSLPVRAGIVAASPDIAHGVLADILGSDYNVCKVVVPSRLGYSEVMLQERGFLLDTGEGAREFEDVGAFIDALKATHALESRSEIDLEPLRMKLKGPAHLNGLCLLIPQSLDALVRKPALLSTLADQADWIFLAGTSQTKLSTTQREAIQLVLDHVTGLQSVMQPLPDSPTTPEAAEEWWKGWKVTLSLGLVRTGTELLRNRLSLLTAPTSELRQYLVETRLHRQLEMTLALMDEETQQAQRQLGTRLNLTKEGLVGPEGAGDLRKAAEAIRSRLTEELDSLNRAIERETKAALAPDGAINRRLRDGATSINADDIEQTHAEAAIKLSLASDTQSRLTQIVLILARERLAGDTQQLREGVECSLRDAESTLEKIAGFRQKLALDFPEESALWESISNVARPEIRYRGEMPRPTLGSRLSAARQGIMSLMVAGTILGGAAALTGGNDGGQNIRTTLYALMLPLLVVGFLWTYVSFRKKERLTLEKEVEKLQDGVLSELRRVVQEINREQQSALNTALQKILRAAHQQIDAALDRLDKQRQRDADDQRRRQTEQQRSVEQRLARLRDLGRQLSSFQSRLADARKVQVQWLSDWINRFNQGKI